MKQNVSYKGEFVSEDFWLANTKQIVSMLEQQKIGYKDIVICKSDSHIGVYIQWLACVEMRFTPIFISPDFSIDSIKLLNENIEAKVVLESIGMKHSIYLISNTCSSPPFLNSIKENSIIHLTSATTGSPKLVVRTLEQIDSELTRYSKYLGIDEKDSILPIVPIYHSFGLISGMLLSRKVNAKLILPDAVLPRNIIQLSNQNKATMMLGVPYFYRKMLTVSDKYTLNNELRYVISSGGPMEEGLQKEFKDRFGIKLLQQYGSTETGSLCIPRGRIYKKVDGKGRTGRLLMNLYLMQNSYPPVNVKFTDRKRYYEAFDSYYRDGSSYAMTEMIANYLEEQLSNVLSYLEY